MARQVLPWVGAAVGFFIGGPAGAQWGFAIGSIVGNAVDPQVISGPKLGEAGLQTSAEGVFRPIVYGTAPVMGNVIARGNRKVKTKRTQQSKGGGPVTEEQRVYWTFAIRICEGPIKGVSRIWEDEKLVYDIRPGSTIPDESANFATRFRLYLGDEDQLPDPDLEAYIGIGDVPSYRGTSYIVFPNADLTDRRESIPMYRFEVVGDGGVFVWDHTWTATEIPSISGTGNSKPAFSPELGVAVYASVSGPFVTSNGIDWDNPEVFSADSVCRSDTAGMFVASRGSNSRIYTSSTGAAPWVLRYDSSDVGGGEVCWSEDRQEFLSIASNAPATSGILYSGSGTSWTQQSLVSGGPKSVRRLIWSRVLQKYVAVCSVAVSANSRVWTSPTGRDSDWTAHGSYDTDWTDVIEVVELGLVVMCGTPTGVGAPTILTTADGSVFTDRTPLGYTNDPAGITYVPATEEVVIIPSDGGGNFLVSSTGTSYTETPGFPMSSGAGAPQWCSSPINKIVSVSVCCDLGDGVILSNSNIENGTTLGEIVSKVHKRAGHTAANYDVSELTDRVFGLVLAGDYDCGGVIRTLMPMYFFDASEHDNGSGYRIHYPKRGKPVVATLTVDDFIQAPEKTIREDALERPKVLHLHYQSPAVGYAPAKATDRRDTPDVTVVGERSIQVPVVFDDQDEPARIARKAMKVVWTEVAGEESFTIHDGWLRLVTADCVGISLRDQTRRLRLNRMWIEAGQLVCSFISDRQSNYTTNITGIPLPPVTPPLPSLAGETIFEFMDIPALTDNNDRLLYYVAGTGESPAWYGYGLQRMALAEVEFSDVTTINSRTVMGELLDSIPAASEHYVDTTNVVRVQLINDDTLDALTDAQFLSEGGSFALEKADGSWEVMQYRDAEDEDDGIFALSYLARGRLNSGASAHSSGARFVMLDSVKSVDAITAYLNTTLTHRAISLGNSSDGATQYADTYAGKSQTEFPVAHLFAERSGDSSGEILELSCVPRHRFGTEVNPVRSVNWTGYRWTVTDGTNTSTRDTTADATAFDVTGWGPLTITVAQLNRFTGAGPTVTELLP